MEILTNIGLYHYLIVALILICIGILGIITSDNIIKTILCLQLILNAVGLNFISFAIYIDSTNLQGLVFHLLILIFTIIQSILMIILLININKNKKSINIQQLDNLEE